MYATLRFLLWGKILKWGCVANVCSYFKVQVCKPALCELNVSPSHYVCLLLSYHR